MKDFNWPLWKIPLCNDLSLIASSPVSDSFDVSEITMRSLVVLLLQDRCVIIHSQRLVPWLNMEFCSLHHWMRQLERRYRRSRFPHSWTVWIHSVRVMHSSFRKREFIVPVKCPLNSTALNDEAAHEHIAPECPRRVLMVDHWFWDLELNV